MDAKTLTATDVPFSSVVGKTVMLTDQSGAVVAQLGVMVPNVNYPYRETAEAVAAHIIATWNRRSDLCASGQQVRALEWDEIDDGKAFRALLPIIGSVRVEPYGCCGWWEVLWSMPGQCDKLIPDVFDNPDEAKAAAQADYERRIIAALTPARQSEGQVQPDAQLNRTFRARSMSELKQMIYDAHGWKRKAGESQSGRIKPLYDFRVDHQSNMIVATPRAPAPSAATPTAQEAVPACAACEDNPKPPNIPCAVGDGVTDDTAALRALKGGDANG